MAFATPSTPRWDEPGIRLHPRLARTPPWAGLLLFAVALWVLKDVGYLVTGGARGYSLLWPPAGLLLFALLATRVRRWPALLVVGFLVGLAGSVAYGRPLGAAVGLNVANLVEAALAAWLVRVATPVATARTVHGVSAFFLGPAAAKLVVVGAWSGVEAARDAFLLDGTSAVFWLGSVLGVATLGWLLLAWSEVSTRQERPRHAVAETILALASLAGAVALIQLEGYFFANEVLLLPPVVWMAVRFGSRGASAAACLAAAGVVFTVWRGHGLLGIHFADPVQTSLAIQLFVAILAAPVAFVAAVVEERSAAEEGRRLLARAMDQSADGLAVYDPEGRILWANAAGARFHGVSPARLEAARVWQLTPGGTEEAWRERWAALAAAGATVRQETTHGADGRVTPWEVSAAIVDVGGRPLAVATMRDVSDRQRASEALRLAGIGALAAGVAHEINNPLATVVANLAVVRERLASVREHGGGDAARLAADTLEPVVDAEDGARRVRDVVAELRVFARAEAARGPVDVGRAMRSALSLAQSEIQHRARLVTRIAAVPPITGSEGRLAQAFANVLVNAARAIPEGASQENEIRVEVRARDGEVVAEIADTGVGMVPEVRSRIFEPFFTTREVGEGSGLGLAVTHAIVTAMGGRIDVDSAPGAGSRFRIVLPAAEPAPPPAPPEGGRGEPGAPRAAAPTPAATTGRLRCLVIDDEPIVARSLQRILAREHDVEAVDRGRVALDRIAAGERFDVVLCDLMMPDVSGMAFYDEVGILDPALRERIVFVTGGAFTEAARGFLDGVSNLRLEKPVDPVTLRDVVRQFGRRA